MKLYYAPGACSLSPHIVLCEAGYSFDLEKVDLAAKKTASGEDFLQVNPRGYVPALRLDDGSVLIEGPAIVQYLADQKPETGLAPPPGSRERYDLVSWLNFISTELHKQYSPLFNPASSADMRKAATDKLTQRYEYLAKELVRRHVSFDTSTNPRHSREGGNPVPQSQRRLRLPTKTGCPPSRA